MKNISLDICVSDTLYQDIERFPAQNMVDLHVHSLWSSDGEYAVGELFAAAKFLGMSHLVIADHDTMCHITRALEAAKLFDIQTMPALELSTVDENRMVHVLAYNFDPKQDTALKNEINKIAESRWEIFSDIARNLRRESFFFEDEKVLELASGKPPVITNFAQAILEDERNEFDKKLEPYRSGGIKSDVPSIRFIRDYLVPGAKCHVPEYQISLPEGISTISEAGAVPVIAHPGQWFTRKDESRLKDFLERGLGGLEVYTPYHDKKKIAYFKSLCEGFSLLATGGSDFHSLSRKPGHCIGQAEGTTAEVFNKLLGKEGI